MSPSIKPTDAIPVGLPILMRFARRTYGSAMRDALKAAGINAMPDNGIYILMGMNRNGPGLTQLTIELGLSKDDASELIDALIAGKYLSRARATAGDQRPSLKLTKEGRNAAQIATSAIESVNKELVDEVGEANVKTAKYVLAVLMDINDRRHDLPRGIR